MSANRITAIVLFAHGARDPEWAHPFRKIRRAVEAKRPGTAVEIAFLEIMDPRLDAAVAKLTREGHRSIAVAPLFMAQGGHLKNDLPKLLDAIRADHPDTEIGLLRAIGDVDAIIDAIAVWVVDATAP